MTPAYLSRAEAATVPPAGAAVARATASRRFRNVEPGLSVRDGSGPDSWDYFRPEQAAPADPRARIAAAMQAYETFGVIRNTFDMMSEFAVQGADLAHTDPATERFYREWWRKVRGPHACERMLNLLFRAANVPVKRTWATLSASDRDLVRRGVASYDETGDVPAGTPRGRVRQRRVPWRYTVLNPLSLEILGGDVAPLIGKVALRYGVRVNRVLVEQLEGVRARNVYPRLNQQIDQLLSECKGGEVVPLPEGDTKVLHYKKDDWQLWATPIAFSIHDDLQALQQLKLADRAALDGATSHVRLWKIGSLDHELWPAQAAVDKLADILAARAPGEVLDVIWGPDIDLVETRSDIHQFLGSDKYLPTWSAIFGGLGVPLSLTGVPGANAAGTTNNWASLKVLVERLEYGRNVLTEFWDEELRHVQRAMGFRKPARLVFDRQSLSDEAAVLRLLIELMDRNVISREAVQERFSLIPEIEKNRTKREARQEKRGQIPPKGGAWDDPTFEKKVLLELLRQQRITPQQAGVDLAEDDALPEGERDRAADPLPPQAGGPAGSGTKGEPGQGREPGQKDTQKRKRPRFSPRASRKALDLLRAEFELAGVPDAAGVAAAALPRVLAAFPAGDFRAARVTPARVRRAALGVSAGPGGPA